MTNILLTGVPDSEEWHPADQGAQPEKFFDDTPEPIIPGSNSLEIPTIADINKMFDEGKLPPREQLQTWVSESKKKTELMQYLLEVTARSTTEWDMIFDGTFAPLGVKFGAKLREGGWSPEKFQDASLKDSIFLA